MLAAFLIDQWKSVAFNNVIVTYITHHMCTSYSVDQKWQLISLQWTFMSNCVHIQGELSVTWASENW